MKQRPSFAEHAMRLALAATFRSEDPYCKVGACLLDCDGLVLGVGYNGPPSGVTLDWTDRDARRRFIVHAEANAMRLVTPWTSEGGLLAVSHFPCEPCILLAASYKVEAIYWRIAPDWERYPAAGSESMAACLGIKLERL